MTLSWKCHPSEPGSSLFKKRGPIGAVTFFQRITGVDWGTIGHRSRVGRLQRAFRAVPIPVSGSDPVVRLKVLWKRRAEWGTGVLNGLQAISDWFFGLQIYLPIAEVSLNIVVLLAIGGGVGLLSGLFGVGGGFLMTPLLIFIGVPPAVAVATQSNQVVAASVSGVLAHWSRDNVDFKMGGVLLGGGILGSSFGVLIFSLLRHFGQIDLVIAISYVVTLGTIGTIMAIESFNALRRVRRRQGTPTKLHQHNWAQGLPFKMRFRKSRLYISATLPIAIGFVVGIMSAIMGVGGAFLMVPAMIYLLGMPTSIVIGTSLFQIIFVQAYVTILQSAQNQTVDLLLAMILTLGGVVGAQFGGRWGAKLPAEQLRLLMALVVLTVAGGLLYQLVAVPRELYAVITLGGPL
jgi:uncharacterized protein